MSRIPTYVAFLLISAAALNCGGNRELSLPGKLPDGRVRLPNGWYLSPAGSHVPVGELPLNMALTPDGRYLLVTNNGTREQSISIIDCASWKTVQTLPVAKSWLGIRLFDHGTRFILSGGNDNRVDLYSFEAGRASRVDSILLGRPWPKERISVAGLDVDDSARVVYVVTKENNSLYVLDLATRTTTVRMQLPAVPYTCLLSHARDRLYVSLWGGSAVAVIDAQLHTVIARIPVGDHPCDMAQSPDGNRLFVANANNNTVSVIDLRSLKVTETISSALTPGAPNGSTPNAVAVSPDGNRLYIANADNNYVAVMDISMPGSARSLGFVPTAWYPTCVRVSADAKTLYVACAKGLTSRANPGGPNPSKPSPTEEWIGEMFSGVVSAIQIPADLRAYTAAVYANSPYNDARRDRPGSGAVNPIPTTVGGSSPIKHVFYIIKENRTYDQVFGDMRTGNGDSALCLFPERVTPNHHKLAREFVLLDNFYCDAEVSADGHNWSMGAYANDYVEKTWPTQYGGRGGDYVYEGESPMVYPATGYLWDACRRAGVSYRTYGEFANNPSKPGDSSAARTPALVGHVAPFYRGWDLSYSDVERVKAWMREFDAFDRNGDLPQLCTFTLPNDHTEGTRKGSLTPRAFVAQNDRALGMLVDRISHSRYWKESAIFVIEDDAQNGPDHVDAHRTVALVMSPYCRRKITDSELYSTSSMVRTIELILGLPPMSQFDAAATPMYASFTSSPDGTPYVAEDATIDLTEVNLAGAYGQDESERMDFTMQDATPEIELNEIIWKSVHGSASAMPAPVRSAFVQVQRASNEDD